MDDILAEEPGDRCAERLRVAEGQTDKAQAVRLREFVEVGSECVIVTPLGLRSFLQRRLL